MEFLSVTEYANLHGMSERTVRHQCATGKLAGAFKVGKTWNIPSDAQPPVKQKLVMPLLKVLREQKAMGLKGGIYHKTQIDFAYNSNYIEGSKLSHEQTRLIFETNTLAASNEFVPVDDIIEANNHFRCVDFVIDRAEERLSQGYIKELHKILKSGTSAAAVSWFAVGEYKKVPNEVGGQETCAPEDVHREMSALLNAYNAQTKHSLESIVDFHQRFEKIHPFQDGNGRVGRLIMFKECLAAGIVPFVITENLKMFYYRGLSNWPDIKGFLLDTCLTAQDIYKTMLAYFRVDY